MDGRRHAGLPLASAGITRLAGHTCRAGRLGHPPRGEPAAPGTRSTGPDDHGRTTVGQRSPACPDPPSTLASAAAAPGAVTAIPTLRPE
jgi:hypothetical protein